VRRALITAGCALALGGCGAGGGSKDSASKPPQRIPLATFNCGQWSVARADIRQTVLDELHGFYGGPVSGKRRTQAYGTVLSDSEATRLLDTYCARPYAGHFTIYKIYARAAAFVGTAP
jgi:hypothetical protein